MAQSHIDYSGLLIGLNLQLNGASEISIRFSSNIESGKAPAQNHTTFTNTQPICVNLYESSLDKYIVYNQNGVQ